MRQTYLSVLLLITLGSLALAQQRNANDILVYPLPSSVQEQDRAGGPSGASTSSSEWRTGDKLVITWAGTDLRRNPGEKSTSLSSLRFGEDVILLGKRATVISEGNRNYLLVKVAGTSQEGWVKESLLSGGGLVAVTRVVPFYESKTYQVTAREEDFFGPGELAILVDFDSNGEWLKLRGRQDGSSEMKEGWIKDFDNVSVRENDIAIATRINEIQKTNDAKLQRQALVGLRGRPEFKQSSMELAVDYALQRTYFPLGISNRPPAKNTSKSSSTSGKKTGKTASKTSNKQTKSSTPPGIVIKEVVDMDTNKSYNRVTETGSIMEVDGPRRPKNKYWCYHKTRPIGSEVLLHVPGGGIVKLEVVARLRPNNANAIGLGKQVLEEVYGSRFAKTASFSYPQ